MKIKKITTLGLLKSGTIFQFVGDLHGMDRSKYIAISEFRPFDNRAVVRIKGGILSIEPNEALVRKV